MAQSELVIRTVETSAEVAAFYTTNALANGTTLPPDAMEDRLREAERWSAVVATTRRAAFRGEQCLGTYQLDERWLTLGAARLRTGCLGWVATHPAFQRQGIGSLLMQDALALASQQHCSMVLLVGIPNFYQRWGFTNIMDYPLQVIQRSDILAQPLSTYHVRPATADDTGSLLALYQQHHGRFERSLALQNYLLRGRLPHNPPFLALDEYDRPRGYLLLPPHANTARAFEVAADDWLAALALLQQHNALVSLLPDSPDALRWPLPLDALSAYLVADHLPMQWQVFCVPDGEWMAHITKLVDVIQALVPLWQARWYRACAAWSGQLTHQIGEYSFTLAFDQTSLELLASPVADAPLVVFSSEVFTTLVFGWRSVAWAMQQPGVAITADTQAVLDVLYPMERLWFPPSDEF